MQYGVITRTPPTTEIGNMAVALPLYIQVEEPTGANSYRGRIESAAAYLGLLAISLRAPVFELGEILILDDGGRELAGKLRKPGKWDVDVELFAGTTAGLAAAIVRANDVMRAAANRALEHAREEIADELETADQL